MTRTPQRRTAALALLAAAALAATGLGTATAAPSPQATPAPAKVVEKADAGTLPAKLSPARRTELIKAADAGKADKARQLGLGAQEKLVVRDIVQDADGTTHTRYERTYKGLPVLGGDMVVSEAKGGKLKGVSMAHKSDIAPATTTAAESADSAEAYALAESRQEGSVKTAADSVRKVVWAAEAGTPVLAWETVVGGLQKDGTPNELHVITDAAGGKELFRYQGVENGTGNTMYSGSVTLGTQASGSTYTLTDTTRGNHKTYNLNRGTSGTGTLFSGPDDVWGDGTPTNLETAGADAHYGAALTWDYYKNVHGRTGIRGDGVGAYSRVHYSSGYVNAFWQDSCFCMTYGDGSGNTHPLTSIDVAAHEMSHGVTAATAGLVYSGESGGLNEATSDIFAAGVEFAANNPNDVGDYLVGEEIDINGDGTPLRYMDKPSRDGASKDNWYSGIGSIDVHYSSGPANHWFYLASEGSGAKVVNGVSYNSPTADGLPVTGIGRANAEKVWFRALTTKFTSNTNYAAARTGTLAAAAELFGQGSVTYNNVANAWAGIGVGARIVDGVTVTNPGAQSSVQNQPDTLQIQATSTNPGALTYAATGLPAGLSINASTGLISGTPTTLGSSNVTVTVRDTANSSGTASFAWTVGDGTQTEFENTTDYAISDYSTVESPIAVTMAGNAPANLQVSVNIIHTYRGDLVVDLVAPDGTAYRLKNSGDGSADNVIATYTVNASSEVATGTWKLRVQDVAGGDIGYIDSWKWSAGGGGPTPRVFENTADYNIPDRGQVESPITVDVTGSAPSALLVDVNIVHTYRGDLVIDLIAPDGTAYRLKNSGDGSADDVIAQYTVNASSETAAGVWKLRVQDVASLDTGYINSWKLTF
ncbi:Transglutaminase-activating metalloprotease [Streptomyces sp. RB5]|uniref:Transglutaminase-activating metalloprotease n=1 Tax=Streptomyces smaragdinus TaxID=2585196 RepID=A0A7K0CF49_9ACTN|nr:Transglutaminase-activating metalloprotease [Streptomyces smaragdinus]